MNLFDNLVVSVITVRIIENYEGKEREGLCISNAMYKIWRASKHYCPYSHYVAGNRYELVTITDNFR